ncbi:MAG TPA: hypothetical protein DHV08_08825 [Rhodocyclaceae bacterium]|nr:MAG: hypothetical protein COW56_07625 [Rhodocyclales bacterium CG17_big_fil_post_rev_8_21_14_2_50_68_7]PJA58709.1 MAG: hypothetical protein CO164_01015 [Rhodocyclales bacterium CG_4_9_14_3_um_filter_68_10]HCX33647.1 hypothetical protein [Rhodocyclaceae bacterium]
MGHSGHPVSVRDQDGTLSAISVERCPPSRRNAVRHQSGTVSGMAWNTQQPSRVRLETLCPSSRRRSWLFRPPRCQTVPQE